ncbi:MAG: proton-conducting transporter membrane subunit, partial [Chromatiaceae bacterium]
MTFDYAHLIPVVPEIAVLVLASILLLVDLWLKDREKGINHVIAVLGLLIAIGLTGLVGGGEREIVLGGTYVRDPMSDVLKIAILLISLLTFVYSRDYLRDRQMMVGEFYVLTLFAVLGMMVMVSANSFLTLYLGLELLALSLYTLVAFDRDSPNGAEAAMKYFVLGALGSGLLLYGLSMLYGATGSLELGAVAGAVALQGATNQVLVFGLVLVVIGIGFKFGAVPFHMWVPDTYQGAPNPVVLFLGSAPKIAAFAMAFRLLVDGLGALHEEWQGMLIILA